MPLPFPIVYHPHYDLHFGAHVFPTQKYRLIRERLLAEGVARPEDFVEPAPVTREQLLLAHDAAWIGKLEAGTLSYHEIVKLEVPYSRRMVEAFFLAAGGTLEAARRALRLGTAFNLGGGFHHAFRGHGEGFCAVNDVAVAICALIEERLIAKAMVLDLDVHQGNGTASIFAGSPGVFTISFHQQNNYPHEKPPSTIDVGLPDGLGDVEYLARLRAVYEPAVTVFRPDILFYVAGADPYYDDQLGGLGLTMEGMKARDRTVFDSAFRSGVPVVTVLAGGYASRLEDTVALHAQTVIAAEEAAAENGFVDRR
jgi:acetoin utilization deacetylase AcuC-like enzyme